MHKIFYLSSRNGKNNVIHSKAIDIHCSISGKQPGNKQNLQRRSKRIADPRITGRTLDARRHPTTASVWRSGHAVWTHARIARRRILMWTVEDVIGGQFAQTQRVLNPFQTLISVASKNIYILARYFRVNTLTAIYLADGNDVDVT